MESLRAILAQVPRPATELPLELAPALAWALAAGPRLAPTAQCEGLRDGALVLRARDASAQAQILSVAGELRHGLNQVLGGERVQRLDVRLAS